MSRFIPYECESHSRMVQVNYSGFHNNKHIFKVSSISRPGLQHRVEIQLTNKFDKVSHPTPEGCLNDGLLFAYSSDEFYLYGGCQYNCTLRNSAIYPEFRSPKTPQHDYVCSHTLLAVLEVLCNMGGGVLQESFSKVLVWDDELHTYQDVPISQ